MFFQLIPNTSRQTSKNLFLETLRCDVWLTDVMMISTFACRMRNDLRFFKGRTWVRFSGLLQSNFQTSSLQIWKMLSVEFVLLRKNKGIRNLADMRFTPASNNTKRQKYSGFWVAWRQMSTSGSLEGRSQQKSISSASEWCVLSSKKGLVRVL